MISKQYTNHNVLFFALLERSSRNTSVGVWVGGPFAFTRPDTALAVLYLRGTALAVFVWNCPVVWLYLWQQKLWDNKKKPVTNPLL